MSETTKITLAQSAELQQALFGYVITDPHVFEAVQATMEVAGNFGWLNPYITRLWTAITRHQESYGTFPSKEEIETSPEILDNETVMQKRLLRELDDALKARASFGLDPILAQLRDWQRAVLIDKQITEMARKYNAGDIPAAIQVIDRLAVRLEQIAGASDSLVASSERVLTEFQERVSADKRLHYGVSFLDDSLGGIATRDLVVIGARTGHGKTQLITRIASSNPGKRISLFALEAEKGEMERRTKYYLARALAKDSGEDIRGVDYDQWISLRAPQLDKHDARATELTRKQLSGLRTYYRVSGDFGVDELEKRMVSAAKTSDLIILDHLHYVDVDSSKNEHVELGRVIKRIRDIVLGYGVPVIVVAHLRKRGGQDRSKLVADVDDIHGASEISKVATSVITFGAIDVTEFATPQPPGMATIFRVAKHRREGSRTRYAGIAFFNPNKGFYETPYSVGHLKVNDSLWEQVDINKIPEWARQRGGVLITAAG